MAAESLSLWWPVSAWVSSGTAWFVFFNVIVGVVAILSWGQQGGDDATVSGRRRLTRSASSMVMDRLRSFNSLSFFSFHSAADYGGVTAQPTSELHHVQLQEYYTSQEEVEAEEIRQAISMVETERTVLVGESRTATMAPSPASAPVATTAALRAGAAEVSTTGSEEAAPTESPDEMAVSLESDESCAVALQPPAAATTAVEAAAKVEGPRKMALAEVPEFADQRRACAEVEEKAEVNARAERFIRQFREDLKLERLNSILNYSRCGGAATAR